MMRFCKPLSTAVFTLALGLGAGAAQAFTPFGQLSFNGGYAATFSHNNIGAAGFADYFTFYLPSYAGGSGAANTTAGIQVSFSNNGVAFIPDVTFSNFGLYSVDSLGGLNAVAQGTLGALTLGGVTYQDVTGAMTFNGLNQNTEYALYIAGTGLQGGSSYSGNISLASAVPEPRTYAMLLAGLGLIGLTAFRRKNQGAAFA